MKESLRSTPNILKKGNTLSMTNIKQKLHLPSRFVHQIASGRNQTANILNSIQTNVKTAEFDKIKSPNSPLKLKLKQKLPDIQKKKQSFQFKSRPLKREENDLLQYKEIFINPIKQNLDALQAKPKGDPLKLVKEISKDYEKLLQFENGGRKKTDPSDEFAELNDKEVKQCFDEAISLLTEDRHAVHQNEEDFYEQQIRIQPPDFPNSSMASTLSPGSGYAPSIPLMSNSSKQNNLKELLLRAKAGMNTEDVQKQAHLSFYLGMVYEEQRNYPAALKFYRRYLGFANGMEDKIGMALGANRVAINYFYNHQVKKSIVFHNQNLKLSDNQNCFAGFYNLGICHRKIQQFQEALEYFQTALQWANQNGEAESQCITLGQIGVTYKYMELYQESLQNFEKSLQLCRKLKKTKLQLRNLSNILLIASRNQLYGENRIIELTAEAYEVDQCSKQLDDKRLQQIYGLNIGIIKGKKEFEDFVEQQHMTADIEYF